MRRKIDLIFSWAILLIGIGHATSVFYFFQPLVDPNAVGPAREPALWWVSGGAALAWGSFLNVLRVKYGQQIREILWACLVANIFMVLFEIWLETNNPDFLLEIRTILLIIQVTVTVFNIQDLRR